MAGEGKVFKNAVITLNGVPITPQVSEVVIEETAGEVNWLIFGNLNEQTAITGISATVRLRGLYTTGADEAKDVVSDALRAGVAVPLVVQAEGTEIGKEQLTGNVFVLGNTMTLPRDNKGEIDVRLKADGDGLTFGSQ